MSHEQPDRPSTCLASRADTARASTGPQTFDSWRRAAAVAATICLVGRSARAAEVKLLVFLHVALKQRAFQSELQAALAGIAVTAVGRIGDFERALKETQDAVLTLPVVLAAHGLSPKMRGQRKGSSEEKYSLVGVDVVPDPARVATVGALDILGRDGMNAFVQTLIGGQPKVERVTKVEDLLPLLQMQRVDSIVLPSRLLNEIKASSRLTLAHRELPGTIGLPAVASAGVGGPAVLAALNRLPKTLLEALGVDQWL